MRLTEVVCLLSLSLIASASSFNGLRADPPSASKAQQTLAAASSQNKFTFIIFWRENDEASSTVGAKLKAALDTRKERASLTGINIADPAEHALVEKYGVSRAPVPLVLVIAPNEAVTGAFNKELTDADIEEALVTPCMMRCIKFLQENKLVFVCVQTAVPQGVAQFKADAQFHDRTEVISLNANDPAEKRFLKDMQVDSATAAVFFAPPAVVVGKFPSTVTMAELGAKLHAAGKCCNDPNCKHNQQGR